MRWIRFGRHDFGSQAASQHFGASQALGASQAFGASQALGASQHFGSSQHFALRQQRIFSKSFGWHDFGAQAGSQAAGAAQQAGAQASPAFADELPNKAIPSTATPIAMPNKYARFI
jgi:hypothetical protein